MDVELKKSTPMVQVKDLLREAAFCIMGSHYVQVSKIATDHLNKRLDTPVRFVFCLETQSIESVSLDRMVTPLKASVHIDDS